MKYIAAVIIAVILSSGLYAGSQLTAGVQSSIVSHLN